MPRDDYIFNLNDQVKVRLTETGRQIHKRQHEQLFNGLAEKYPYIPPKEDADGWSSWQLWSLMSTFGPHIRLGSIEQPFETTILLSPS